MSWRRKIAAGPPIAIRLARRAIYRNQDADLRAALEYETYSQNICRETEDAKEGIKAFVEKARRRYFAAVSFAVRHRADRVRHFEAAPAGRPIRKRGRTPFPLL